MLTAKQIEHAKPFGKSYKISDGNGLYLLITPKGSKLWRYDYAFDKRRKTIAYGIYPEVSLSDARKLHTTAKVLLKEGVDPVLDRQQKKVVDKYETITFEFVAKQWFEHWRHGKNAHYTLTAWNRIEREVLPAFGRKPIREISAWDIKTFIATIVSRGAFDIAKRTLEKINQICRYGYVHEYLEEQIISFKASELIPSRKKVNHSRIQASEIPKLLKDINEYDGSIITTIAIKLMMLTFVRTSELIKAEWSEIDFEKMLWTIPAERMKMKRTHIVPLSQQSLKILNELKNYSSGTKWLFPSSHGRKGEKAISNNTILFALYRMGYKGKMTGHGFRGLASTTLHEMNYDHHHIEMQLAHSSQSEISAAYNHAQYLPQRTKLMQDWADYITSQGEI